MHVVQLAIGVIIADPEIQSRVTFDEGCAKDYADEIKIGKLFPPVTVFFDGEKYWLADGFHRLRAHVLAEYSSIPAEVQTGTKRDAIFFAAGCNGAHGLRRTNEDKRKAVLMLMLDQHWGTWSDNKIAKACRVTQPYVSGIRNELINNGYRFQVEREKIVKQDDPKIPCVGSVSYMLAISKRLKHQIRPEVYPEHFSILDRSSYDPDEMEEFDSQISKLKNEMRDMRAALRNKRNQLSLLEAKRQLLTRKGGDA